jgi:hypothetical protein
MWSFICVDVSEERIPSILRLTVMIQEYAEVIELNNKLSVAE